MPDQSLIGLSNLLKKLHKIDKAVAQKHLRSAAMYATSSTVSQLKAAAPRGTQAHRTYKGNLVAPGFLSRSIKRKTVIKGGRLKVSIGVRREAWYGVHFLDETGTKHMPGRRWFKSTFAQNSPVILGRFKDKLRKRIEAAAR